MKLITIALLSASLLFGAVDINNAPQEELETLSGIGAKKAAAIVAYRTDNCFKSIDQLKEVKGISDKTVAKNKENLEVGACKK